MDYGPTGSLFPACAAPADLQTNPAATLEFAVRGRLLLDHDALISPEAKHLLDIRDLEAEGVEYVFGIPGEENLDLLESLRHSSIKLVLTRHEQGAGFMAATYGRLTGNVGVCLSTLGPGATNLVTAAAYAQLGNFEAVSER